MLELIQSGVECHDATKGLRESFFKAVVLSDRLGARCQVKYRLELYEVPQGRKQPSSREKSPPFYVSPLQKYLIMLKFHVESASTDSSEVTWENTC